jgi:hypothetical protein
MNLEAIDKFHKTRQGHLVFGLLELALAYVVASLAIDSGSLLQYLVTIILFVGAIQNFVSIFRSPKNEHKRR